MFKSLVRYLKHCLLKEALGVKELYPVLNYWNNLKQIKLIANFHRQISFHELIAMKILLSVDDFGEGQNTPFNGIFRIQWTINNF